MTEQLALLGGAPVRTAPWPAWPVYDEREERALLEVLHSGAWGVNAGEGRVTAFEHAFAKCTMRPTRRRCTTGRRRSLCPSMRWASTTAPR